MARKRTWTDEQLVAAVKSETSYSGVLRSLGLKLCGGSHAQLKLKIKQLKLDVTHFTGQGWCKGDMHKDFIQKITIPLEQILVRDSTYTSTHSLKKRLWKEKLLDNKCYECGSPPEWNGKPLSLQLDHIDGDRCNNLIENLRVVCPNCHSQTPTFAGKAKKKPK
jgi:hypothetical protein